MAAHKRCDFKESTQSEVVTSEACFFFGYLVGMNGADDVRLSFHDGSDNADPEVVPSNTYDASALNANGALFTVPIFCENGLYLNIESGANYEIVTYFCTQLDAHEARHWQI